MVISRVGVGGSCRRASVGVESRKVKAAWTLLITRILLSVSFTGSLTSQVCSAGTPRPVWLTILQKKSASHVQMSRGRGGQRGLVHRSGAFMGRQRATLPCNCWIVSGDDPVQLSRESLSWLCDGDSGCVKGLLETVFLFFLERGAEMRPCEDAGIEKKKKKT